MDHVSFITEACAQTLKYAAKLKINLICER